MFENQTVPLAFKITSGSTVLGAVRVPLFPRRRAEFMGYIVKALLPSDGAEIMGGQYGRGRWKVLPTRWKTGEELVAAQTHCHTHLAPHPNHSPISLSQSVVEPCETPRRPMVTNTTSKSNPPVINSNHGAASGNQVALQSHDHVVTSRYLFNLSAVKVARGVSGDVGHEGKMLQFLLHSLECNILRERGKIGKLKCSVRVGMARSA